MKKDHTLPIPADLLCRACDAICRCAGSIPLKREGVTVTRELVAAAMEELNAEPTRTLPFSTRTAPRGAVAPDSFDRHLTQRGFSAKDATCIAKVLIASGIVARASVMDRRSRRILRGLRLAAPWTWAIVEEPFRTEDFVDLSYGSDAAASWVSLCPVCRQGRLEHVREEQLFGLPRTDFLSCTFCGARFVPDSEKFRLVSIVHRKDPQWQQFLNMARTPSEWRQLAMAGFFQERGKHSHDQSKRDRERDPSPPVFQRTLAFDLGNRTLFFTHVPLKIIHRNVRNRFEGRRESLRTILHLPPFASLVNNVESRYGAYLDVPVGFFLSELKARGNPLFSRFLHSYGEGTFCSFRAVESDTLSRCGVYLVVAGQKILAAGSSLCPFRMTIDLLGAVPPAACYLDGDPHRCRVNALLCSTQSCAGLYFYAVSDGPEVAPIIAEIALRHPGSVVQPEQW